MEGKKYCADCQWGCKRECISCHKPYPNDKKKFTLNAKRCDSCTIRNENAKLSRKSGGKKIYQKLRLKDLVSSDGDEEEEEEPIVKRKKKRKTKPLSDNEEEDNDGVEGAKDADSVASSEVLTISDNDSVQEEEEEEDHSPKPIPRKKAAISPETQPMKTVLDLMMEEAAEKGKKKTNSRTAKPTHGDGANHRKRSYTKKPPQEKSPIQAEKDLVQALINYKKTSAYKTQINVIFVPHDE